MKMPPRGRILLILGLATTVFWFAACGGGESAKGDTSDSESISGRIVIDGSSTVGPIAEAAAEEFGKVNDVQVSVGISGTGGGFEKFCRGETDISDASRPVKTSEIQACASAGIEMTEFKVGQDGLTMVVNPANTWASCLKFSQLRQIFDQESQVTNWNQVDPSFPDEPLKVYSPGVDSGTFDFLSEVVNGVLDQFRNDSVVTFSEDDNVLVLGVEADKGAIGYFGIAYYKENQDKLKALQVSQDEKAAQPLATTQITPCVAPSEATVLDTSYPLSRPLFMYVNNKSLKEKPQVRAFLEFVMKNPSLVADVGYIRLPDFDYQNNLTNLEAVK